MNYFAIPEMMNFGNELIDVVFPAFTGERNSSVPAFHTNASPIVASTAQNRDHRLCDSEIAIPRDIVRETTPVDLDSICDLSGLIDNPVVAKYLKVLSHAYWYYSKYIDYNLTEEMKRSYIQETIEAVTRGLIPGSKRLVNTATRGERTRPVFIISKQFFAHHIKCYHEQIRSQLTNISQNHYCLYMFSLPYAPNAKLNRQTNEISVELVKKTAFINGCGWLIRNKSTTRAFSYRADATNNHANTTPEFKAIIAMTGRTLKPHRALAYMYKPITNAVISMFAREPENVDVSAGTGIDFSERNYLGGNYSLNNINDYIINVK